MLPGPRRKEHLSLARPTEGSSSFLGPSSLWHTTWRSHLWRSTGAMWKSVALWLFVSYRLSGCDLESRERRPIHPKMMTTESNNVSILDRWQCSAYVNIKIISQYIILPLSSATFRYISSLIQKNILHYSYPVTFHFGMYLCTYDKVWPFCSIIRTLFYILRHEPSKISLRSLQFKDWFQRCRSHLFPPPSPFTMTQRVLTVDSLLSYVRAIKMFEKYNQRGIGANDRSRYLVKAP